MSRIRPCPARAVPVAAALVYIVLALIQFAGLPGRTMDFLQIAIMVLLIGFVQWSGAATDPVVLLAELSVLLLSRCVPSRPLSEGQLTRL